MKITNNYLFRLPLKIAVLLVFILSFTSSCSSIDDCFSNAGNNSYKFFDIQDFDKIKVMPGMALVIKQGNPEIKVEAGENLIEKVKISKQGDCLILENEVGCNFSRDNRVATVYVTTNNLIEVDSKTEQDIRTDGVVTFPILRFLNIKDDIGNGTGNYFIEVNNGQLVFEVNSTVNFHVKGVTQSFLIGNYNGDSRILAQELQANNIELNYRGSNDAFLFPTNEIKGKILSTGNVYIYNNPPIINVEQLYTGRLIQN